MVTHVTPTGAETVLDRQPLSLADPTYNVISNSIPALALAKGHYRLKVLNGDVVLATGDFTVGSAVAHPIMDKGNLYGKAEIAEIGSVLDRALAPGGACAGRAGCDVNAHRDRSDPKCRPVTADPGSGCLDDWTARQADLGGGAGPAYIVFKRGSCGSGGCTENLIVREGVLWTVIAATFGRGISVGPPIVNGRATIEIDAGAADFGPAQQQAEAGEDRVGQFTWNGNQYVTED